jgi:PAS domain S-box-containing protein
LLTFTGTAQIKDGRIMDYRQITDLSVLIDSVTAVRSVVEDGEGNIWIGTSGKGLHRFKEAQITAYTAEDGLSDASFVTIADDGEGGLWLGSESAGLFRLQGNAFIRDPLPLSPWALLRDSQGGLWIGSYAGLVKYDEGRIIPFHQFDQIPVMSVYEDRESAIWIATLRSHAPGNEGGLYRYKNGEFKLYRTNDGLVHNEVHFITEDRHRAIWIGTEGGLSRFKDGAFTNYTTENGLSHNYVRSIYEDADGTLWIGTYGGGLNRFKDGRFVHITTKEGLFDNVVSRILEDGHGNFWMSCNRGIFRARRDELNQLADGRLHRVTSISYGVADGMKSSECNGGGQPAGWKTSDGRLWFPTVKGVVVVDPNKINTLAPLVAIEEVVAGKTRLAFANTVELPPSQRDLEIHYTGLSFAAPEKVRFRYQLEGYDSDWVDADTRRVAYYTNIPAGQYRFRVIASNNDGVWNEAGATVEFSLQPHFYETWYFYGLMVVLLLLVGRGAHALRVRQLEERNRQLAAKVAERTAEVVEQKDKLAEANDNMLAMLNQLQIGVAMTDPDGRVTFFSRAAERLFGQRQEEVLNEPWEKLFPLQKQDQARLKDLYQSTQPARVSLQVQSSTGQQFWIEIEASEDPRDPRQRIFFLYDVSQVYDLRRMLDEKAKFHDLVGQSKVMLLVYQQIQDLAQVDSTVLIEGETGTGKELAARAIHYVSPRRTKPFVAVNCAGLTESLLASQLFGHKRGAFTGAVADQMGVFEAAGGGTLFLDEIGDIPASVQTNLLRVLQEKEITRLGESKPRQIDVRLIAATNRDLSQEVAAGRFREDLLYRIRVTRIHLPPLRERREDIPLLVAWFLGQFRAAEEESVRDVSQEAMQTLVNYSWPGNVRELKSAIESAVVRCKGPMIQVADLPPELTGTAPRSMLIGGLMQDEKQRILDALERTGGNRKAAARLLGMGRSTLYRKLEELGIKPE